MDCDDWFAVGFVALIMFGLVLVVLCWVVPLVRCL